MSSLRLVLPCSGQTSGPGPCSPALHPGRLGPVTSFSELGFLSGKWGGSPCLGRWWSDSTVIPFPVLLLSGDPQHRLLLRPRATSAAWRIRMSRCTLLCAHPDPHRHNFPTSYVLRNSAGPFVEAQARASGSGCTNY